MVRINCFFQANEGKYDAALQAALALTAASQKQEGCVSYDVFESGTRSDVLRNLDKCRSSRSSCC